MFDGVSRTRSVDEKKDSLCSTSIGSKAMAVSIYREL